MTRLAAVTRWAQAQLWALGAWCLRNLVLLLVAPLVIAGGFVVAWCMWALLTVTGN